MLVKEYDAMMEAKGTPKVWSVDYGTSYGSGMVHRMLFLTEQEAKQFYDSFDPERYYRKMYRTWDIWNFTKRELARRAAR